MSRGLNSGDVNFDVCLVKVYLLGLSPIKLLLFPFLIIKHLVGRYFETLHIAYLSHIFF